MKFTLLALVAYIACIHLCQAYKLTNVQAYLSMKRTFLRNVSLAERRNNLQRMATAPTAAAPTRAPARGPPGPRGPRPLAAHLMLPKLLPGYSPNSRQYRPYGYGYRFSRGSCRNDLTRHRRHHVCRDVQQCGFPNNDLDVLFVLDRSGSVGPCDFKKELQFVEALVCQLDGAVTRLGIVSFASRTRVDVPLCLHQNSCALVDEVRAVRYHGGSTATACGLNAVNTIFDETDRTFRKCFMTSTTAQPRAPDSTPSVLGSGDEENVTTESAIGSGQDLPPSQRVFVITDGKSNTGGNPALSAARLRRRGAEVFALGVTRSVNMRELRSIASPDSCNSACAAEIMPEWAPGKTCPEECVDKHVFYLEEFSDFTELAQLFSNDPTSHGRCSRCPSRSQPAVDGGWSPWEPWSKCPKPSMRLCGRVQRRYQHRMRRCNSPRHSACGRPCQGRRLQRRVCFNQFVKCPEPPICPLDKPAVKCAVNPCARRSCRAFPKAKCTPNYCGKCSAVYKINGMEVDCLTEKRLCDGIHCGTGSVCVERTPGFAECCGLLNVYARQRAPPGGSISMFPIKPTKCIPAQMVHQPQLQQTA